MDAYVEILNTRIHTAIAVSCPPQLLLTELLDKANALYSYAYEMDIEWIGQQIRAYDNNSVYVDNVIRKIHELEADVEQLLVLIKHRQWEG